MGEKSCVLNAGVNISVCVSQGRCNFSSKIMTPAYSNKLRS